MNGRFLFLASAIFFAVCITGCQAPDRYIVTGKDTTGRCPDGEWAYLCVQKNFPGDIHFIDSVKITDNGFRFEGTIDKPVTAFIMTRMYNHSQQFRKPLLLHRFILENGQIKTDCNMSVHTPSGTPLNDKITAFYNEEAKIIEQAEQQRLNKKQISDVDFELVRNLVAQNADNEFALFLVDNKAREFTAAQQLELFALLPNSEEYFAKEIAVAARAVQTEVGGHYIDIAEPDVAGNNVSLKSVVEKEGNRYVLLEFWASWCGPCMNEMPGLKAAYEQYHSKGFEVYASSLDIDKQKWLDGIEKIDAEWVNVSSLRIHEGIAPSEYFVSAIPANFLIDCSTGEIVAKNLRGKQLNEKLMELFRI